MGHMYGHNGCEKPRHCMGRQNFARSGAISCAQSTGDRGATKCTSGVDVSRLLKGSVPISDLSLFSAIASGLMATVRSLGVTTGVAVCRFNDFRPAFRRHELLTNQGVQSSTPESRSYSQKRSLQRLCRMGCQYHLYRL